MGTFKDIIFLLRNEKGFSQEKLSKELNISKSTIAMWETGSRMPSPEKLEEIADYFHVSIDYLLGRSDYKTFNDRVFETDITSLRKAFNNAPALVKNHFSHIIDVVFLLSFHSSQDKNDIEYVELIEQIFCCLYQIRLAGLNNIIIEPTAKEVTEKYQHFLTQQTELNNLITQLFYYSKWNDFTSKD